MKYMIGCNYWGSKHGIDMWKYWDEQSIRCDLQNLSKYGVKYLRVFPNWRDFQPIQTLYGCAGTEREVRFEGDVKVDNEFGLDMTKIKQFETFCDIAKENGIKLVVAILTGWMSGRLYVPPALAGKNLISDPEALAWESRFIRGFVKNLKHREEIAYWDLGNECNNLGQAKSVWETYVFTANARNSILAEDNSRQIMSGMHGLGVDCTNNWHIQEQAELTDVLTPHPYPSPTIGGNTEPMNRIKTSLLPTAQLAVYNGVGRKPVMIQEQGTFNDMLGDEETVSQWMEVNLWSGWANGSLGYLWWCAHDQHHLINPPHSWSMIENELGILKGDYSPKQCAFTMKKVGDAIFALPFKELPKSEIDAVCVIPYQESSFMAVASSAYILAKQAGINMTFTYCEDYKAELPDAKFYLIPGSAFWPTMNVNVYKTICEKVKNGASLLVTTESNTLVNSKEVFQIATKGIKKDTGTFVADFGEYKLPISYATKYLAYSTGAEVLAKDSDGTVIFSKNNYGKGKTYFLNFPIEKFTFDNVDSFISHPYYKIYQTVAKDILKDKPAISNDPNVCLTIHPKENSNQAVVVAINYSDKPISSNVIKFKAGVKATKVYGDGEYLPGCSAFIYEIEK